MLRRCLNHFAKTSQKYYGLTLIYIRLCSTFRSCWKSSDLPALSGVPDQEVQGPRVELRDVLVDRRVRAALEDDEFRAADRLGERAGEADRGHRVVLAEGDLGGRLDEAERAGHIVREHGVGLTEEGVHRRHRAAADEGGERVDVLRLRRVKLGREAP